MRRLTETELMGRPADTLLEAVSYCSGGREQEHEKPGETGPAPIHSLSMEVAVPLGPNAVHMYTGLF